MEYLIDELSVEKVGNWKISVVKNTVQQGATWGTPVVASGIVGDCVDDRQIACIKQRYLVYLGKFSGLNEM